MSGTDRFPVRPDSATCEKNRVPRRSVQFRSVVLIQPQDVDRVVAVVGDEVLSGEMGLLLPAPFNKFVRISD